MITRVQQGISTGYSALITWPDASPAAFDALFKTAKGKGMLVGTFYDGGSTTNQNVDVGTDFGEAAKQAVASLAKRKGQQNIGQITISDTAPAKTFTDALVAAAAKTKNVKLIASVFDGGDATKDVDLSVNMLTAHPEVNVLVSPEGAATPGMVSGVNQTNSKGKVVLVMNGTANGGSQALDAGIGYSASVSDICNAGKTMVDSLIKIKKGQTTPAFLPIPVLFVTKANYQHYVNTLGWS
jgi:ABC-type sugar transport system substrate-binding protein